MNIDKLLGDFRPFLTNLFSQALESKIDLKSKEIDHICYRVETVEEYNTLKQQLMKTEKLLSEAMINGRPISTFKLKSPILFGNITIPLLELPSPKPGKPKPRGFEHIEVVLGHNNFSGFMSEHKHIQWETHALEKSHNPDISMKLPAGKIKFHEKSLETVIKEEEGLNL